MDIKVNVEINFSQDAKDFIRSILSAVQTRIKASGMDNALPSGEAVTALSATDDASVKAAATPQTNEAAAPTPAASAATPQLEEPQLKPGEVVYLSDEHLRKEMDFIFQTRICEDWANVQGEQLKKKRIITALFKKIAGDLGAPESKPTLLPREKRQEFIDQIRNIVTGEDGIPVILPF